jgi:hypothetical protein
MNYQNVIPNQLGQTAITTSVAVLYTVPSSTRTYLKDINICNTAGSSTNVNVYIVPSSGTASTSNALLYSQAIASNSAYRWTGVQVLLPNETIQVSASATGCSIIASGGEAT